MPEAPAPITPEGRRAAEKVRTIFFLIVAANIVVIAILAWNHWAAKQESHPPGASAQARDSDTKPSR